jgi:hypothetical protein
VAATVQEEAAPMLIVHPNMYNWLTLLQRFPKMSVEDITEMWWEMMIVGDGIVAAMRALHGPIITLSFWDDEEEISDED